MNRKYSKAYTEVLEIIRYLPEEEQSKIPKEKIDFFEKNKDKEYYFKINPQIDLEEQNISREANTIFIVLFRDYFATAEQKIKLREILELNEKKSEQVKTEKYNPENIFKKSSNNDNIQENGEEVQLVEYKETFFLKLKKFIFRLLNKDN